MSHYAYGMGWGSASAGPLNLFKMTVGEGGIRGPLLVSGPGIKGDRKVENFTYVWDIMPTILEFADVSHPKKYKGQEIAPMNGRSIKNVLKGSTKAAYGSDEFICGEMQDGKWVRQEDFKAVSVSPPYGTSQWQLYNLAIDPGEVHNLAQQQPEKLEKFKAAWERYADDVGVVPMGKR